LGCDSRFVDPYPPQLELLEREQQVGPRDAPLVYGLIFDLNLPNTAECFRVKSQITSRMRAVLLPAGREGLEMAVQDLAPECQQSGDRLLSTASYDAWLGRAQAQFGAARVKPVLIYFNNVNLPLPNSLQVQLSQLRFWSLGPALVWGVTTPEAEQGVTYDNQSPWTYSSDGQLTAGLESAAKQQLPLLVVDAPPGGYPLFTPAELASVRAFKACTPVPTLKGANFTFSQKAVTVNPADPPRLQVTVAAQPPAPRTQTIPTRSVRFKLEVCHEHCERLYTTPPEGELLAWDVTPRCLLVDTP
jgi:hypothetical protein